MLDNRQSYVMYESTYKHILRLQQTLGADVAINFFKAVSEFGLYGVVPYDDDINWVYGLEQTLTSIGCAKERYNHSVENGKGGGRPRKDLDRDAVYEKYQELKTWKKVAEYYDVSDDTLRKLRKQWDADVDTQSEKPKNPNDNVNVNVNNNDNENDKQPSAFDAGKRAWELEQSGLDPISAKKIADLGF